MLTETPHAQHSHRAHVRDEQPEALRSESIHLRPHKLKLSKPGDRQPGLSDPNLACLPSTHCLRVLWGWPCWARLPAWWSSCSFHGAWGRPRVGGGCRRCHPRKMGAVPKLPAMGFSSSQALLLNRRPLRVAVRSTNKSVSVSEPQFTHL